MSKNQYTKNNDKVGSFAINVYHKNKNTSTLVPIANNHLQPTFFNHIISPVSMVN